MFDRQSTKQIKGVAIILMLAHHLFVFKDRIPYGLMPDSFFKIEGINLSEIIGIFGKICVAMFMFLGGYGLYKSTVRTEDGKTVIEGKLARQIVNLYKTYWKIFVIFVPVGFIFFGNYRQWCDEPFNEVFSRFDFKEMLLCFSGFSNEYNKEWWFFRTYIFAIFEGYIFIKIFKNVSNIYAEMLAVMVWHILITYIFPVLETIKGLEVMTSDVWFNNIFTINNYMTILLVGIIWAKYNVFDKWLNKINDYSPFEQVIVSVFVIVMSCLMRVFVMPTEMNIVITPVFIMALDVCINKSGILKKITLFLGKHSTNIWLVHSFYCYYYYPAVKIVYASKIAIIDYLILMLFSILTSILIDVIWKLIARIYSVKNMLMKNKLGS